MGAFQIKRIYDEPAASDGTRVLVDRIWPRGVSKQRARLDDWMKGVAPSTDLRKWFDHRPERFRLFREKYEMELQTIASKEDITQLLEWSQEGTVTLIFAAKDEQHNHAIVLQSYLERLARGREAE